MYIVYFVLVPMILIAIFVITNLFPSLSKYYGNPGNLVSFLSALLTYIYVILTGLMVRQMIKTSEEESRPFIIVDFDFNDNLVHFVIHNIGRLPAKNVQIKLSPDLIAIGNRSVNETIFSKPISLMPPGKEIKTFVGVSHEVLKDDEPKVFEATVSYEWGRKHKAEEKYTLDISFYKKVLFVDRKSIHDIAKSLNEINKNLSKVIKWDGIYIKTTEDLRIEAEETRKFYEEMKSTAENDS